MSRQSSEEDQPVYELLQPVITHGDAAELITRNAAVADLHAVRISHFIRGMLPSTLSVLLSFCSRFCIGSSSGGLLSLYFQDQFSTFILAFKLTALKDFAPNDFIWRITS